VGLVARSSRRGRVLLAMSPIAWQSQTVNVAGTTLQVTRGGQGAPVLVLHHDIGSPPALPFYDALAARFTVIRPSHPGYDGSPRPDWMRGVRDIAVLYQGLLAEDAATRAPGAVAVVGLGFGGWIAAELATMAPRALRALVLVGAMGVKPERSDIADQALVSYLDYVRAGFAEPAAFERVYGAQPPTGVLEQWDLNREMTFRIAWKPYMYNPTLPHLLGAVAAPTLVVWGREDRIVPLECGERYVKSLPRARLEIVDGAGHLVDMEQPDALASLVTRFLSEA
jgi:pimeloyl-ACP methyl ester carboxylesterase